MYHMQAFEGVACTFLRVTYFRQYEEVRLLLQFYFCSKSLFFIEVMIVIYILILAAGRSCNGSLICCRCAICHFQVGLWPDFSPSSLTALQAYIDNYPHPA